MRSETIEKIGFFHFVKFGEAPSDPVGELRNAIEERIEKEKYRDDQWEICNSLIVLPEAFNIGKYCQQSIPPKQPAQECLEALRALAEMHRIIFVAGILDEGRRNSVYLIDAKTATLMCHKIGEDGEPIYDPCTGNPDPCNPIHFRHGICVGALICMDADDNAQPRIKQRQSDFLERLDACKCQNIVCVPARFSLYTKNRLDWLGDCWYVVAQGRPEMNDKAGSYIAKGLDIKAEAGITNEVHVWSLPQRPNVAPIPAESPAFR